MTDLGDGTQHFGSLDHWLGRTEAQLRAGDIDSIVVGPFTIYLRWSAMRERFTVQSYEHGAMRHEGLFYTYADAIEAADRVRRQHAVELAMRALSLSTD